MKRVTTALLRSRLALYETAGAAVPHCFTAAEPPCRVCLLLAFAARDYAMSPPLARYAFIACQWNIRHAFAFTTRSRSTRQHRTVRYREGEEKRRRWHKENMRMEDAFAHTNVTEAQLAVALPIMLFCRCLAFTPPDADAPLRCFRHATIALRYYDFAAYAVMSLRDDDDYAFTLQNREEERAGEWQGVNGSLHASLATAMTPPHDTSARARVCRDILI